MGRHAAADGAGTDPIVAAALASQDGAASGTRHATADGSPDGGTGSSTDNGTDGGTESGLGWPGDTTTGGGLGWPGGIDRAAAQDARPAGEPAQVVETVGAVDADAERAVVEAAEDVLRETTRMDAVPAVPDPRDVLGDDPADGLGDDAEPPTRRGWRRIFGGTAA
ncbi:hypothetical protein ACI78R_00695 [Geodermatophilus sp. SYSU D01106]